MGIDQAQITQFLKAVMVATGTWRLKLTDNKFLQILFNIYSVIFQCSFLAFFLSLVLNLPTLLKKQNLQLLLEFSGFIVAVSVQLIKVIISQTTKVINLIQRTISEEIWTYEEEYEKIQHIFLKNVKILNQVNLMPVIISTGAISTLGVAKYVEYIEFKEFNSTIDKPLVFPIWYPFNTSIHYGTAFIIGMYFGTVSVINNIVTQVLFFTLMTYAALQLKILKICAMEFHLCCESHCNSIKYNERNDVLVVLRNICVKHQSIISFVDDLNAAMKYALLLECLLNSISIASSMVQGFIMPNTPKMIIFYEFYLVGQVIQLFLLSWHANEIEVESISLSDAMFQSKWYEHSEEAKRIISIIMLRSRKPLSLFIGPFYPMRNSTALSTMKTAYSYITMICTMATKE